MAIPLLRLLQCLTRSQGTPPAGGGTSTASPALSLATRLAAPEPTPLYTVKLGESDYDLRLPAERAVIDRVFTAWFGEETRLEDFIAVFAEENVGLRVLSLELSFPTANQLLTRVVLRNGIASSQGSYYAIWQRKEDGHLAKTAQSRLEMGGNSRRKGLKVQANLVRFCRQTGRVDEFKIWACDVGRYAYRFMDGMQIDPTSLHDVRAAYSDYRGISGHDDALMTMEMALTAAASPRELCDAIVLRRIPPRWMERVSEIIARRGFNFTVDQVVDVARRPGLALLMDRDGYELHINPLDDTSYQVYQQAIDEALARRALQRIRGVLGSSFQHLSIEARNGLIVYRPFLIPEPRQSPEIPDLSDLNVPTPEFRVVALRSTDGHPVPTLPCDVPNKALRGYREIEVNNIVTAIERGVPIVSVTGLSGSGKTEVVIWNLEKELSLRGHRVVSLDTLVMNRHLTGTALSSLLSAIDGALQPTILIFDESAYFGNGRFRDAAVEFARNFLQHTGNHIVFVGGGTIAPDSQQRKIAEQLAELWDRFDHEHITLYPKHINYRQAYRFLGLGRTPWMSEADKRRYLQFIFAKIPTLFPLLMNLRLHEHPEVTNLEQALAAVDSEVDLPFWQEAIGIILEAA